jgi:long-chain acyl-CoA synthetase
MLAQSARAWPQRTAISVGQRHVTTYAELAHGAASFAAHLHQRGLHPGDRVLLGMRNCPEYFTYLFGCWWGGYVAAPVNAALHPLEIAGIASDLAPKLAVMDTYLAGELTDTLPVLERGGDAAAAALQDGGAPRPTERMLSDPAWVFYTSGTTGAPKGACLSHGNLYAMSTAYLADVDNLSPQDTLVHLAATSHASGLFGLSFIARGAEHVMMPSGGYDAQEFRDILSARTSVTFFAPTTLLARMRGDGIGELAASHIRRVLTGAGPVLVQDLKNAVETFGPRVWNGYGQGESPCTITAMDAAAVAQAVCEGDDAALASVGWPRSATAVRVLGEDGNDAPDGEAGEICVQGPTVMSGYLNQPEATADALQGGWLHTGDMGRFDTQGRLHLLDRLKDIIISGGMNVYAREVEDVLASHAGVREVAVIGRADAEWGELVMALIVPHDEGASQRLEESLDALCLSRLARFKRPKAYVIRTSLPRNSAGKILKSLLHKEFF